MEYAVDYILVPSGLLLPSVVAMDLGTVLVQAFCFGSDAPISLFLVH